MNSQAISKVNPQSFDLEEMRLHLWCQLEELSHPMQADYAMLESCLAELALIDRFWAYPGTMVIDQIKHYFDTEQWVLLHQLGHNTLETLIDQAYRNQAFIPFDTSLMQLKNNGVTH